jgi:ribonuclease Y
MSIDWVGLSIGFVIGLVFAGLLFFVVYKNKEKQINEQIERAKKAAEKIEKEAYLKGRQQLQEERKRFRNQVAEKEKELQYEQNKIRNMEKEIRRKEHQLDEERKSLMEKQKDLVRLKEHLEKLAENWETVTRDEIRKLEEIAGLTSEEAKQELMDKIKNDARVQVSQEIVEMRNEAIERAKWEAREIMAYAIERMATEYTMESTLSNVSLPNDNWKGVIIGKEGRNIKAFESATDVKVIVDDTPEIVVLSSFDPVKREIARIAMERLIQKKNINPKNIEREVAEATRIVEREMKKAAEETLKRLNIRNVHPEMKEYLGRLRYRTSYGQNILQHSIEVALLAGNMAAELGLDVQLARRAGLFHDIGKAVSNESEGSHVALGVEVATRCKEHEVVINSILAHHEEAEPISPISVLVTAADRISGARPGARRESLEAYAKRIQKLEELANSFEGVAKTYALSAGREIRVIVEPTNVKDEDTQMLASEIAKTIKENMEYPGQVKVTVIRQTQHVKYTDEFLTGIPSREKIPDLPFLSKDSDNEALKSLED